MAYDRRLFSYESPSTLLPHYIKTWKPIDDRSWTTDYVGEIWQFAKIHHDRLYGGAPTHRLRDIGLKRRAWLFCFDFCLVSSVRAQSWVEASIMAQTTRHDARMYLLGVRMLPVNISGIISSKLPKIYPPNRHLKPKWKCRIFQEQSEIDDRCQLITIKNGDPKPNDDVISGLSRSLKTKTVYLLKQRKGLDNS